MKMSLSSLVQRAGVVVGLIVLSVYLFYIGKGHTLLVDTNAVTIDGKELASAELISVAIDGKEPEEMGRAERIIVNLAGPSHTIVISVVSGDEKKVEKAFRLPTFIDSPLLSIPAILGGAPEAHWVKTFVAEEVEEAPAEQMQHQEDTPAEAAAKP